MLAEGLIREVGTSVFFGDFDEFKTTVLLDFALHAPMARLGRASRLGLVHSFGMAWMLTTFAPNFSPLKRSCDA